MNGSFTLFPHNGSQFNVDQLRQFLLSHAAVVTAEHRNDMLIVAQDGEEASRIRAELTEEPDRPHWAIFIYLTPERLHVYREAPQETLDYFRPILESLLTSGNVGSVHDEEGRDMNMKDIDQLIDSLLI